MGIIRAAGQLKSGRIWFRDQAMSTMTERQKRQIRGLRSHDLQDPMASLTPTSGGQPD
jgi:ABC-type microcin C transport system duplicated ATPase subunit YejF